MMDDTHTPIYDETRRAVAWGEADDETWMGSPGTLGVAAVVDDDIVAAGNAYVELPRTEYRRKGDRIPKNHPTPGKRRKMTRAARTKANSIRKIREEKAAADAAKLATIRAALGSR